MSGTKTFMGRCAAAGVITGLAVVAGPVVGSAVAAPDPGGAAALAQAYKATSAAGTAKVALHEQVQVAGKAVTLVANGATNFAKHSVQLTMALPQVGTLEVRTIGTMEYLKLPAALQNKLPAKTPWVRIDTTKIAGNQMGSTLGGVTPQDPSQVLGYLQAASAVTKVGAASVNGVSTIEYRVNVDVAKLAAAQGASQQQLDQIKQTLGSGTLAIEVWIDNQHRIRQEKLAVPVSGQAAGASSGKVTIQLNLSDFGLPVNVVAPPASQTTDLTAQLLQATKTAQKGQVQMPAGGVATGNGSTAGIEHKGLLYGGSGALLAGLTLGGLLLGRRRQHA